MPEGAQRIYVTQWWRKIVGSIDFELIFPKEPYKKWGKDLPKCNAHEMSHIIHP